MRILRCADSGLLIELDSLRRVQELHSALAESPPDGVTDVIPAARTVLLRLDPGKADVAAIERSVRELRPGTYRPRDRGLLCVPVVYDGEDLAEVAKLTGLTEREVVQEHTDFAWTVAFGGFAPGFGYLTGGSPKLAVPRREESRTKVPKGAVGLAGEFSGIYPRESPGGWQLIGRTELEIWQPDRDPPALLRPGVRVRFEEAG